MIRFFILIFLLYKVIIMNGYLFIYRWLFIMIVLYGKEVNIKDFIISIFFL